MIILFILIHKISITQTKTKMSKTSRPLHLVQHVGAASKPNLTHLFAVTASMWYVKSAFILIQGAWSVQGEFRWGSCPLLKWKLLIHFSISAIMCCLVTVRPNYLNIKNTLSICNSIKMVKLRIVRKVVVNNTCKYIY